MRGSDGYRRLAAAVLTKAVKDYVLYHMDGAEALRAAYRASKTPAADLRRKGLAGFQDAHARQILEIPCDPGEFLFNDSPFHTLAGVDPERFLRLNFHDAYREIRWATTTMNV